MNSVVRILLVLVLLFVFGPFFIELLHGGNQHDNARRVSCASNLKQLGIAMTEYVQDYDGSLPAIDLTAAGGTATWRDSIFPYIKSPEVYRCPNDDTDYRGSSSPMALPHSYGASRLGMYGKGTAPGALSVPLCSPPTLQTIMLVDMRGSTGGGWDIVSPAFLPSTGRELYIHVPRHIFYERPGGTLNCLFADGHVTRLKPMATLAPLNLWTRDNAPFTGQDLQNARAILNHAEEE